MSGLAGERRHGRGRLLRCPGRLVTEMIAKRGSTASSKVSATVGRRRVEDPARRRGRCGRDRRERRRPRAAGAVAGPRRWPRSGPCGSDRRRVTPMDVPVAAARRARRRRRGSRSPTSTIAITSSVELPPPPPPPSELTASMVGAGRGRGLGAVPVDDRAVGVGLLDGEADRARLGGLGEEREHRVLAGGHVAAGPGHLLHDRVVAAAGLLERALPAGTGREGVDREAGGNGRG